ncbi:hypothetical protein POJ06DRAFT_248131 [Lipomyces tetrasporus]|uniref:DUF1993 domain-containing protein n=1 Tax=Lipomyces tetrasporus TaxID=54092 RepID=A0AAD7VUI6_9ASCO|nr:uncharacterized protein POJ06DRAFT_248131 [Lipomyces tetrasporus]KAJ8101874.1 hypothetical protein POJ06DRAFT_248131 [Lipomyces tetrasporus]
MSAPLYDFSIPLFIRGLNTLSHIIEKGEEYANEKGIPLSELPEWRLAPDMKPLSFQVQIASNTAKNSIVRVAGTEPVPMEDNETTIEALQARITKTIELLKAVDASKFTGKEEAPVTLKIGPKEELMTGQSYITNFALPNYFFHLNIAYAILRSKGVPIGKADYLTSFNTEA